ncbi:hypothetical protein G6F37_009423 [Rhizopus arrhizus]|nr:hypothetical protein G6F38_008515 [Rhizopus arrhizus]KAG1154467.1 hypothetical protein G6F37_009423 [Rhizopus arrhizus]
MFSLSTLSISALSTPALLYFWQEPVAQVADISNTMFLGASGCSTGALSFLLSPYVNHIYLHQPKQTIASEAPITPETIITIETLDLLARRRQTTVQLRELRPINSSFLTWTVDRNVLRQYYASGQSQRIRQTRFWLDQRNGTGDQEIMSKMLRTVYQRSKY